MTESEPGPIEAAALANLEGLDSSGVNGALVQLAFRLARENDVQPTAALAKELHSVLRTLADASKAGEIDELFARLTSPL